MEIIVEEQDGMYCVCVKVEKYDPRVKRKTIVDTKEVKRKVTQMGYQVGAPVQEAKIHNLNGVTQGTWFFKKKAEKPLDNSPKEVIIVEEKSVQPKPTRKRRTGSSAKKVSTEE